jgi:hypothetical protein
MASRPDPFEEFATEVGLRLRTEEISAAPRDVLAPAADQDRYYLVTIAGRRDDSAEFRTLFGTGSDEAPPSTRDVLWWLASDSWAIEDSKRDYHRWAATHNQSYSRAGLHLFELHARQADKARDLLGDALYRKLLSLYEVAVSAGR